MYKDNEAYKEFVRSRIDGLRIRKNISEYKLSLDLGKSQDYIQSITSGRTMPSLEALCDICSYFEITPTEFFDPDIDNPNLFHEIMDIIKKMPERDAKLLLFILNSNEERSNRNQTKLS